MIMIMIAILSHIPRFSFLHIFILFLCRAQPSSTIHNRLLEQVCLVVCLWYILCDSRNWIFSLHVGESLQHGFQTFLCVLIEVVVLIAVIYIFGYPLRLYLQFLFFFLLFHHIHRFFSSLPCICHQCNLHESEKYLQMVKKAMSLSVIFGEPHWL